MSGKDKLREVQQGVELTATEVQGGWVKVVVTKDEGEISGWVYEKNLVVDPKTAFVTLTVRSQPEVRSAIHYFMWMDSDANGIATS